MVDCATVDDLVNLEIELKKAIIELAESLRANALTPEFDRILEGFIKDVDTYMQMVDIQVKQAEESREMEKLKEIHKDDLD